jgi:hypothetical protein
MGGKEESQMIEHAAETKSPDSSIQERKRDASMDAAVAPRAIPNTIATLHYCRRLLAAEVPVQLEELAGLPVPQDQVENLEREIMAVVRPYLVAAEARLEADLRSLGAALSEHVEAAIASHVGAGEGA